MDNGYKLKLSTYKCDGCIVSFLTAGIAKGRSFTTLVFGDFFEMMQHNDLKRATAKNIELAHSRLMEVIDKYLDQAHKFYDGKKLTTLNGI